MINWRINWIMNLMKSGAVPDLTYIKVPYFTSFRFPASSIIGLGLGLVVGLGTVLVLFFYCIFSFPV